MVSSLNGCSAWCRSSHFRIDNSNADAIAFEALCRAHIKAFAKGAEKYKAETNLTKRVGDWQGRLTPKLAQEELRPVFDIHKYSQHVVDSIVKEVSTKKRKSDGDPVKVRICHVMKPHELCTLTSVQNLFSRLLV